jgi:hypothetical protein
MIDWWEVISNAIWISGCALALAVLSYANWQAGTTGQRLRDILAWKRLRLTLDIAGMLFCLGLAATSHAWLEVALWLALTAALVIQTRHDRGRSQS